MQLPSDASAYLNGQRFSDSYYLTLRRARDGGDDELVDRITLLERLVAARTVVHVGCVDHTPEQIRKRLDKGNWLHARIDRAARRCLGVDIDADGIEYMRSELGYPEVVHGNLAESTLEAITSARWEILLLGELVEHLNDPVGFLGEMRRRYKDHVASVIITVPNAFRFKNFLVGLGGAEKINSDHRYWFTPYTIAKVLHEAGLTVQEIYMVSSGPLKRRSLKYVVAKRFFMLRDRIVVLATL